MVEPGVHPKSPTRIVGMVCPHSKFCSAGYQRWSCCSLRQYYRQRSSDSHLLHYRKAGNRGKLQYQYPDLWNQYFLVKLAVTTSAWDPHHLSKVRLTALIVEFATRMASNFLLPTSPPDSPIDWSVDFCIAGGCFKSIFTGNEPSDLDVWPTTTDDHSKLLHLLQSNKAATIVAANLYNTQFKVSQGTTSLLVELVTKCNPPSLQEKVEKFDIAISAIGVQFHVEFKSSEGRKEQHWECTPTAVYIHKEWTRSFELKQPLLILPMPNSPFLLATAERVLRYAQEFNWKKPQIQLEYLKSCYDASQSKELWIANYRNITRGGENQRMVCEMFNIKL